MCLTSKRMPFYPSRSIGVLHLFLDSLKLWNGNNSCKSFDLICLNIYFFVNGLCTNACWIYRGRLFCARAGTEFKDFGGFFGGGLIQQMKLFLWLPGFDLQLSLKHNATLGIENVLSSYESVTLGTMSKFQETTILTFTQLPCTAGHVFDILKCVPQPIEHLIFFLLFACDTHSVISSTLHCS